MSSKTGICVCCFALVSLPMISFGAIDGGDVLAIDGGDALAIDGGDAVAIDGGDLLAIDGGDLLAIDGGDALAIDGGDVVAIDGGDVVAIDGGDGFTNNYGESLLSSFSGQVAAIAADRSAISVMGRKIEFAQPVTDIQLGDYVKGELFMDVSTGASVLVVTALEKADAMSFVSGEITSINYALGTAVVGGFKVDYTGLLSTGFVPVVGGFMDVSGYGTLDSLVAAPVATALR